MWCCTMALWLIKSLIVETFTARTVCAAEKVMGVKMIAIVPVPFICLLVVCRIYLYQFAKLLIISNIPKQISKFFLHSVFRTIF